jgi:hypothetical protein
MDGAERKPVGESAWLEGADLVVVDGRRELALRVGDLGLGGREIELLAERLLALGRLAYASGQRAGRRARERAQGATLPEVATGRG